MAQLVLYGEPGFIPDGDPYYRHRPELRLPPVEMVVNHIKPQSQGGKNHSDNCNVLCFYCSNLKTDIELPPCYFPYLGSLGKEFEIAFIENKIFKRRSNTELSYAIYVWRQRLLDRAGREQTPLKSDLRRKRFPQL